MTIYTGRYKNPKRIHGMEFQEIVLENAFRLFQQGNVTANKHGIILLESCTDHRKDQSHEFTADERFTQEYTYYTKLIVSYKLSLEREELDTLTREELEQQIKNYQKERERIIHC